MTAAPEAALLAEAARCLRLGEAAQAEAMLAQAAVSAPVLIELAQARLHGGRFADALEAALDAVQLDPLAWRTHDALGRCLVALEADGDAVAAFRASAALRHAEMERRERFEVPLHFLQHNLEQIAYLEATDDAARDLDLIAEADRVRLAADLAGLRAADGGEGAMMAVSGPDSRRLVNLPPWRHDAQPPAGALLSSTAALHDADARLAAGPPAFAVIDDLLTEEALAGLRRECLGSTVWRRPHRGGYVGAFPEDGFASALILAIARALRAALPRTLGDHRLAQWWAFAYDPGLGGTAVHADDADISVNLWLTETAANRMEGRGGLHIWDRTPPADWTFDDYNGRPAEVTRWLAEVGARRQTIPYAGNRAVIFPGHLFHASDGAVFADGFAARRRNLTFLFRRSNAGQSPCQA